MQSSPEGVSIHPAPTKPATPPPFKRLVSKSGHLDVITKTPSLWNPFNFNNAVRQPWVSILLQFTLIYVFTWTLFAFFYMSIQHECEKNQKLNSTNPNIKARRYEACCIRDVSGLSSAFLFSLETQQTIGYGERVISANCFVVNLLVTMQSIMGLLLVSAMTGLLLSKFVFSFTHHRSVFFSEKALVMRRGAHLFLGIRIADLDEDQLRDATVDALIFHPAQTMEGEKIHYQPSELKFGFQMDGTNSQLPTLWPVVMVHKINCHSPLYHMGPADLAASRLEIVVWVCGYSSDTQAFIQTRTSYTAEEIVWGANFTQLPVSATGSQFRAVYKADILNMYAMSSLPPISAAEMEEQGEILEC